MNTEIICKGCGKVYNEIEYIVGQCNDCDPFEDEDLMEELFGYEA